jgi:hypothetical protein
MLIERTYIADIKHQLQYKDTRSVLRWCGNHNVAIFSDYGTRKKYVLRIEFTNALTIQSDKYCSDMYGSDKLPKLLPISINTVPLKEKQNSITYLPKGQHEKSFLTSLLNKTHEL